MAYSASQRSSPIHACGMRWGRTDAQHSPRPGTDAEVKTEEGTGSCKTAMNDGAHGAFQGAPCRSENPRVSFQLRA